VAEAWGADDPRTVALWQQCAERYPAFSPPGQAWAVTFAAGRGDVVPAAVQAACRRIAAQGLLHPSPEVRVRAVALAMKPELALSVWLRRLSQDPAAAVRAAAARLAGEQQVFQMADRLAQMAEADPDQTVRPIARFHLQLLQPVRPAGGTVP